MLQCCYSPVSPNTIGMAKWRSLRKSRIQFLGQHPRSLHLMEGHRDKLPHPTPHRILSWSCLSSDPVQVQETNHTLYTDAALILFLLRNSHLNLYLNLSFCNCLVVYLFCQSQWWVNARTIVLIYDIFPLHSATYVTTDLFFQKLHMFYFCFVSTHFSIWLRNRIYVRLQVVDWQY